MVLRGEKVIILLLLCIVLLYFFVLSLFLSSKTQNTGFLSYNHLPENLDGGMLELEVPVERQGREAGQRDSNQESSIGILLGF